MGEYAGKGLAGTALGLAIPGTVALANQLFSGGNGLLGGLMGGGGCNNQVMNLMAENSMLKSENYSDKVANEVYKQSVTDNKELSDRIFDKYIEPMSKEICDMKVREARMEGKIGEVALIANNGLTALQGQVNCLAQTVNGITKTVVPIGAVCPQPMPQYNSFVVPTTTTTTTG